MTRKGTVYLIHFSAALAHARHYLGWADDVEARLARHRAGAGARLLRAVAAAGIGFRVVRTWEGDRDFERSLKKRKNAHLLCPVCRARCLAKQRRRQRETRRRRRRQIAA